MLLHTESPTDVLVYYRDELNEEIGEGAKTTIIQEYEAIPSFDREWNVQRKHLCQQFATGSEGLCRGDFNETSVQIAE